MKILQEIEYNRERIQPKAEDSLYLHLADLRQALQSVATDAPIRILDYGCGGSPYRSLFPKAIYHRADYSSGESLDFLIDETSRLHGVEAGSYDLVLSTQVLEHVLSPETYLAEAMRILRPQGRLVLSTHGTFPDHACPHDYFRWTAEGLQTLLIKVGFVQERILKLTTNTRALFCLGESYLDKVGDKKTTPEKIIWFLFRKTFWTRRAKRNLWIDKRYPECRVVMQVDFPYHPLYIGMLVEAKKP
ncbi:class I SAM-dependent methyltransferase [bacterium]|nr:class I SAM-dependent methyltransferase [bacterium]